MVRNPFYGAVMRLMTDIDDDQELVAVLSELDLTPVAGRISAATAILQGVADTLFVEGARPLGDTMSGPTALRVAPEHDHGLTWH